MMNLSRDLEGFTLFYNGPKCGASAPDHMHFQAGNRGFMPMEDQMASAERDIIVSGGSVELSIVKGMSHPCFCIRTSAVDKGEKMFDLVYNVLTIPEGEPEPMLNVLCWYEDGLWTILVFPRKKHRPSCYAAEGRRQHSYQPRVGRYGRRVYHPVGERLRKDHRSRHQDNL